MRMQLLKIVVILLIAGSGDTRPQNGADSQAKTIEKNDEGWRGVQVSSKSHDIVRDDSRYTGTSGSNRKSYITHFRDSGDSSREHNAVGSRSGDFAPTARSFSARRSKIDDIWTMPEFRAINAPPHFSRTDVLGEIAKIATVRNSGESDRSSFRASSSNSKMAQTENMDWAKFNSLKVDRTNYFGKVNNGNLERSKSGVTSNENLESVVAQTKYSYSVGNDFLATHASGSERTNDDISVAVENRWKLNPVRSDSFANRGIEGDTSRWKLEQGVNKSSSLQIARTNVSQVDVATRSVPKYHNPSRKNIDSIVSSYENSKTSVVTDSSRRIDNQRDGLNNSGRSAHDAETALIPNSKPEVVDHNRSPAFPRRNAPAFHRNFVKLRYPYSTSTWRNATNVALDTKLKNGNDASGFTGIQLRQPAKSNFTQTAAKKPVGLNDHATKNSHSSFNQKSPSQAVSGGNKTGDEYATPVKYNAYLKTWPNEALQDIEDLYNYNKYTSSLEEESSDEDLSNVDETPILSSNNYFDHTDPILDSSVKKIIHWLKVPEIVPNSTEFFDYNDDKPIEPIFESIYENLEPNRPLSISANDNYETVVHQDTNQGNLDKTDYHAQYPIRWSNPSSITRPQYATGSSTPPDSLIPSSWPDAASLNNKTIFTPITHVSQNTVVHILNDGSKKPNVTVTQLKAPETDTADEVASLGSSSESLELAQRPNVHIMFTSEKEKDKEHTKQETNTIPSSTNKVNCPTIMINTYTRVNNTIQSKEGCTDLNIIVNSHVSNTNVFTPSGAEDQQTSLATQSYGDADENEKYADAFTDLSHEDSANNYVTVSTGTYSSNPLETSQSGQHDYYDSQKDPTEIPEQWNDQTSGLSTIEVFQGTQISVSGTSVPLAEVEATAIPAGSSVDGPAVGPGDDASSSAVVPPAGGASASGPSVAGGSESAPVELPPYLIKPGPVKGQASGGLGSLQLPSLSNLPSIAIKPGLPSITNPSLSAAAGSVGSSSDDDDDDFDMSPGGMLQSLATAFTYFSFLNPLSYGIFSIAAAPFAAMAAGMIGVAAVVFPWALPSVLDIGRSAKTVGFAPNLEEFVRRAVHKYDRLNEWKSRRRKRRR